MIVKIVRGIGSPGKLWTGSTPETGEIVDARIFERTCECGASTRRLRTTPIENASALEAVCKIPTLFVTMGGVGSVSGETRDGDDVSRNPISLQLWNWSGRIGGYAIVEPLTHVGGYWRMDDLPAPKDDFRGGWIQTYCGSTLSEFVLIRRNVVGGDGERCEGHELETVPLSGKCPPCRDRAEMEGTPEGLEITQTEFISAGGTAEQFGKLLAELGTKALGARSLVQLAQGKYSPHAELYRATVKVAKERAYPRGQAYYLRAGGVTPTEQPAP